jgi:hypothetical protein
MPSKLIVLINGLVYLCSSLSPLPGLTSISYTAVYKGTVNDPTDFPLPSKSHGSYHWAFERLLSAGLVPLTAAAFATSGSQYLVLDGLLGISLVMQSHRGTSLSFLKSYRGAMLTYSLFLCK